MSALLIANSQIKALDSYSKSFEQRIKQTPGFEQGIEARSLTIFQINVGKWCNQACHHCHVEASPLRKEMMSRETIDICLDWIQKIPSVQIVDITGGAPEGNPHFTYLVERLSEMGKQIIDRCNLTILEEPGFAYLYDFLAKHKVELFTSLPHFDQALTDKQRGDKVFEKSIQALKKLNELGYGDQLRLNLVSNPTGLFVSSSQKQLEKEFKKNLWDRYGIQFNELFCINNMPISRYLNALLKAGKFEFYMDVLVNAFNPSTIPNLMCRDQISIDFNGNIFDCDFNQMLELPVETQKNIRDFDLVAFLNRTIAIRNHCFGCTAGSGSSCGGEIA